MKNLMRNVVTILLAGMTLSACGGDGAPAASGSVVVADVSKSTAVIGLRDEAKAVLADRVQEMEAPSSVTFLAFNMQVGSSACPPVQVELEWDDNSTRLQDTRDGYVQPAVDALDPYIQCALDSFGEGGTDVFGAISAGASSLEGLAGSRTLDVVTDGCHTAKKLRTCVNSVADAEYRAELLDQLPAVWKPDLSGVKVTFHGVGRGSDLESDAILGLKALYEEYGEEAGATVEFED